MSRLASGFTVFFQGQQSFTQHYFHILGERHEGNEFNKPAMLEILIMESQRNILIFTDAYSRHGRGR